MHASLRALLTGLIDYAGLFPPAGLPLDEAIRNYARYRQEPESWMLGRFICPATQLRELSPNQENFSLRISAIGQKGTTVAEVHEKLLQDLRTIGSFSDAQGGRAAVDAIELRLPQDLADPGSDFAAANLPRSITGLINALSSVALSPWYEFFPLSNWHLAVPTFLATVANDNMFGLSEHRLRCFPAGFKLRCGGLKPSAFPTPEQVAFTIAACRDAKVPLKFTAGLHHPIRHFNAEVQTHMHGFINVFAAGVLAHARGLNAEQLRPILADEDANNFAFDDDGLRRKEQWASTEEIARARQHGVTSFGSCSFDEPRDDLRALGWL